MTVLFQNSTTFKTNGGMSDHDIVQANNELKRRKDKLRYSIAMGICVVFMAIRFLQGAHFGYVGFLVNVFIGAAIGFIPAELVVRKTYGTGTGIGVGVSSAKIYKYTFTDEKILVTCDFDTATIPYGEIEAVKQNPYSYFVYHAGNRYQIDKNGFSVDPKEFEKLMMNIGLTMGVELSNF